MQAALRIGIEQRLVLFEVSDQVGPVPVALRRVADRIQLQLDFIQAQIVP